MKRLLLAACFLFLFPCLSSADEVDKGLPANTSAKIKESTRQAIQQGVEPNSLIKMTQRMISVNFTDQQIIAGLDLLIKARKQDIPIDPIVSKFFEGTAKNAGAEKILQVMEEVRSRYEYAAAYTKSMKIDEGRARDVTKEVVDCRTANMDVAGMNKIKDLLQVKIQNSTKSQASDLIDKTLSTARTMARSGVDSNDIVDVMSSALKRNYNAGQMEKLGDTFMTQAKGMSSPSELARAYSSAIKNGATPDNFTAFDQSSTPPAGGRPVMGAPPPPNSGIAGSGEPSSSKALAGSSAPGGAPGPAPAGGPGPAALPPSGAPAGPAPGAPPK